MKRRIKRQLKEDKFQKTVTNFVEFTKRHTKEISIASAGVAVLVLAVFVYQLIGAQQIKKENQILDRIWTLSAEVKENPERLAELEELAGSGKFTRIGYLELAKYFYEKEEFAKVTPYLDEIFKGKRDMIYYQAQDLLGQVYFSQKDYDSAIALYAKLEQENPESYVLDAVLFHKAQAHEKKGEIDESLALYNRLKEEFAQTYYGYDASSKVLNLEGKK